MQELHVQAQPPLPLVSCSGYGHLPSTALHTPSPKSHPLPFLKLFSFLAGPQGTWDLVPSKRLNPLLVPSTGRAVLTTGPPGKSLKDSSLCHLLDEPFGTRLITTSWTGFQYPHCRPPPPALPTGAAEGLTHCHQPCHMGPILDQMGTDALQRIRGNS